MLIMQQVSTIYAKLVRNFYRNIKKFTKILLYNTPALPYNNNTIRNGWCIQKELEDEKCILIQYTPFGDCRRSNTIRRSKDTKLYADITLEISAETMRKPKVQKAQASISQAKGQGRTRTLRNQWAAGSVFIFRAGGFLMGFGKGKSFSGSGFLQRGGGSGENGRKNLCC